MKTKNIYIIAGSNGAGKTTFANEFLPKYAHCPYFVNADTIAYGLSPFKPELVAFSAGKIVLKHIEEFAKSGANFGFETTLSGRAYVNILKRLKNDGYILNMFYLWVPNAKLALARIENRVISGGHNIPIDDVNRRFYRSLSNFFKLYLPILNSWILFDNSGLKPIKVAEFKNKTLEINNNVLFETIKNEAKK